MASFVSGYVRGGGSCSCVPRRKHARSPSSTSTSRRRNGARALLAKQQQEEVLVPVANGTEEMEAVIIADVLRRAGVQVCVASIEDSKLVKCSRMVELVADELMEDVVSRKFAAIALPGGMPGSERLRDSEVLSGALETHTGLLSAICAAPAVVLEDRGLCDGRKATCHPAFQGQLNNLSSDRVAIDGKLITSQGPGTAFEFSLALVSHLLGEDKASEVAAPMVLPPAVGCQSHKKEEEEQLRCLGEAKLFEAAKKEKNACPKVLVPIANGTEEMEAVIIVDVLRRAGMEVTVASVENDLDVIAARNVCLRANTLIQDCVGLKFDAILLPGGMPGAENLAASSLLIELLSSQEKSGELYGAICASPAVVFEPNELLRDKCATCHPAFMQGLSTTSEARVVLHDNCITSRGPGTAFEFALCVICILLGPQKMKEVAGPMVLPSTLSLADIAKKLSFSPC